MPWAQSNSSGVPYPQALLCVLLIGSGLVFALRGPVRAIRDTSINDLVSPYAQAVAWVHGVDPYSADSLLTFWPKQGISYHPDPHQIKDRSLLLKHGIPRAYPLTCFVILAPFTALSWPLFKSLSVLLTVIFFMAAVRCLISITRSRMKAGLALTISALLLAPFQTGIATCNLAIIAVELAIIAIWADLAKKQFVAGILIALCIALKPQIGAGLFIYYLVRRNWRTSGTALVATILIACLGVVRLNQAHTEWIANYVTDNRALVSTGVLGDFTDKNPTRFGLVNLQVAVFPVFRNREETNISVLALCSILVAAWFFLMRKPSGSSNSLLPVSVISVLSLIPIYHRFYDAALLIIPISYLLNNLNKKSDKPTLIALASSAFFIVPGGSLLYVLRDRGVIPIRLTVQGWWNSLVMAHAAWCLFFLAGTLLYLMAMDISRRPMDVVPNSH